MKLWTGEQEFKSFGKLFNYQPYVVRQFYKYEEEMKYKLSKIPIGLNTENPEEIVYLDLKHSTHCLILGSTGDGKTTLLSGAFDRIFSANGSVFNTDLKGEYLHKNEPLQPYYHKFILRSERPKPLNILSYYPHFFTKFVTRQLVQNERFIQFSLGDMNKFDLLTLLNFVEGRVLEIVDDIWRQYESKEINTWEEVIEYVGNIEDIHPTTKRGLIYSLKNLVASDVIGDKFAPPDVVKNLNDGLAVNLNLKGITQFGHMQNPASAYLAIFLRQIYSAKAQHKLNPNKHHFIFIDEINRFCPLIGHSSSKDEILKLIDLSRSERISLWVSSQDYKRIPDTLMRQATYIFLSYKVDLEDACEIIKRSLPSEYDVPQTFKAKIASIIGGMRRYKDGRRDWLVIDKKNRDYFFIQPLLPLSHLTSEGE